MLPENDLQSLTLSGRDCWFLCGQCHGRIQKQPWQRPRGRSNISSVYPSVKEERIQPGFLPKSGVNKSTRTRNQTHKQQRKHGLSNIEAMSPVVVGDVTVSPLDGVHPSGQGLCDRRDTANNDGEKNEVKCQVDSLFIHMVERLEAGREGAPVRVSCLPYLCWDFKFLYHPQLEEAADATLDELKVWQGEVTEAELQQLHRLGVRDGGLLHTGKHTAGSQFYGPKTRRN